MLTMTDFVGGDFRMIFEMRIDVTLSPCPSFPPLSHLRQHILLTHLQATLCVRIALAAHVFAGYRADAFELSHS